MKRFKNAISRKRKIGNDEEKRDSFYEFYEFKNILIKNDFKIFIKAILEKNPLLFSNIGWLLSQYYQLDVGVSSTEEVSDRYSRDHRGKPAYQQSRTQSPTYSVTSRGSSFYEEEDLDEKEVDFNEEIVDPCSTFTNNVFCNISISFSRLNIGKGSDQYINYILHGIYYYLYPSLLAYYNYLENYKIYGYDADNREDLIATSLDMPIFNTLLKIEEVIKNNPDPLDINLQNLDSSVFNGIGRADFKTACLIESGAIETEEILLYDFSNRCYICYNIHSQIDDIKSYLNNLIEEVVKLKDKYADVEGGNMGNKNNQFPYQLLRDYGHRRYADQALKEIGAYSMKLETIEEYFNYKISKPLPLDEALILAVKKNLHTIINAYLTNVLEDMLPVLTIAINQSLANSINYIYSIYKNEDEYAEWAELTIRCIIQENIKKHGYDGYHKPFYQRGSFKTALNISRSQVHQSSRRLFSRSRVM